MTSGAKGETTREESTVREEPRVCEEVLECFGDVFGSKGQREHWQACPGRSVARSGATLFGCFWAVSSLLREMFTGAARLQCAPSHEQASRTPPQATSSATTLFTFLDLVNQQFFHIPSQTLSTSSSGMSTSTSFQALFFVIGRPKNEKDDIEKRRAFLDFSACSVLHRNVEGSKKREGSVFVLCALVQFFALSLASRRTVGANGSRGATSKKSVRRCA